MALYYPTAIYLFLFIYSPEQLLMFLQKVKLYLKSVMLSVNFRLTFQKARVTPWRPKSGSSDPRLHPVMLWCVAGRAVVSAQSRPVTAIPMWRSLCGDPYVDCLTHHSQIVHWRRPMTCLLQAHHSSITCRQTQRNTTLNRCWINVGPASNDAGPTLIQHWFNVLCLLCCHVPSTNNSAAVSTITNSQRNLLLLYLTHSPQSGY